MFRLRDSNDDVQLVVLRGTAQQTFSVRAVEFKSEFDSVARMADAEKNLVEQLGIALRDHCGGASCGSG